jgi:GAF domain-containing protein/HAMP domain-containing protein
MAQYPVSNDDREKMTTNNRQAQTFAQRFALVLLAASLMALPFYYYLATKSDSWQMTALFYINIPFVIASSVGLWLERRGRIALGICLMLGVMGLVVVAASLLLSRIGIIAGLGFPILAFFVASHTLNQREATWIDIYSVFVGGASIIANSFSQSTQIIIPSVQIALPVMALILVLLAGVTLFRRFSSFPLRIKLVIVLVGVAIFSIAAVAFTTYLVISKEIQQQAGASLSSVANGKALEIGATLSRSKNTMESLVLNETLQDYLKATNVKSTSDPAYLAILDKQWIAAKDETYPLIKTALNNQTADELREYQGRFPEFVEIFLTNKFGGNIASTSRTSDYYQADEDWWQAAWNNGMGGFYISLPQFDESTGLYAIDLALPVYAEPSSEIIGILRATINVTALKDTLRAGAFGRTGKVDLVFPNKRFLQGDTANKVMMLSLKSANQLDSLHESFGLFNYEDQPSLVSKNLVSTNNTKDKGAIESLGWYVVAHQDTAEALEPATIVVRSIVLTALAVLLLASVLAFYIGRQLTIPLAQLTSAAVKVSKGDLTAQASVTSKDEIGILATTFNSMTVQLQNLIGALEQRVAERTRALSTVADVGTTATTILETDKLLQEVVDLSKERFGFYHSHIYLLKDEGDTLVLASGAGDVGRQMVTEGHSIPLDRERSLVARAARQRKGVTVNDITAAPDFLPNPLLPNTRSELAVPMIVGEQVIGVFDVQSDEVGRFTEADIAIQTTLASQIASAVQNARLFSQANSSKQEAQKSAEQLSEALTIAKLANWEYDVYQDLFTFNDHFYSIFRTTVEKVGGYKISSADYARNFVHPDDAALVGNEIQKVLASKERFLSVDMEHRILFSDGETGYIAVRIKVERDENGKIIRWYGANQDVTERRRLEELMSQRARRQEAINLITQKIQAAPTIEEAMQVAARELGHALGKRQTLIALDASALAGETNNH